MLAEDDNSRQDVSTWLPSILCKGIFSCLASTARGLPSIPVMILPPRSAAAAMSGPYTHDHVILSNHTCWSIPSSAPETGQIWLRGALIATMNKCGYRESSLVEPNQRSRAQHCVFDTWQVWATRRMRVADSNRAHRWGESEASEVVLRCSFLMPCVW